MGNPTWLWVGLVYAAAVWLMRRSGIELPRRIAWLFYLLVLVFAWPAMTRDYVLVEVDFLKMIPPWVFVVKDHQIGNQQMNDVFFQLTPWAHQVREAWRSLHVPLWNEMSGGGYPLLANGQSAALSPLRILGLPLSLGHSMTFEAATKILVALTFTFLLCRRRYSEIASAVGAVSYGFTMYIVVWLNFAHSTAAALIPALLYTVDLLAARITYVRFIAAAVAGCFILFAGHPETAAHAVFLTFLFVLWIIFVERPFKDFKAGIRYASAVAGAGVLAGMLAAPFLLPFVEALPKSKRYFDLKMQVETVLPYTELKAAILILQPHFFGQIPQEKPWGPAEAESVTAFSGILGIAGFFALLASIIATRSWRSREAFYVIASPLILGVVFKWPGVSDLFHAIFHLAANARLRLLLGFLFALQAAALVDMIVRGRRIAVLCGVAAASVLLLISFKATDFPGDFARDTALIAVLPTLVVLLVTLLAVVASRGKAIVLPLLLAAVTVELWTPGRGWNPPVPGSLMYPRTPMLEKMEELRAADPEPFRIVGMGAVLFPNLSAVYGLEDIRSHDPMANGRYMAILSHLSKGYDPGDYFVHWRDAETRLLDYLNVKYLLGTPQFEPEDRERWNLVYEGRDGRIYRNHDVLPRFYPVRNVFLEFRQDQFVRKLLNHTDWAHTAILDGLHVENDRMRTDLLAPRPSGSPEPTLRLISRDRTDYVMRVIAPRYSLIGSSMAFWPGWRVERNGKQIEPIRMNGAFFGFAVPPGTSTVHVYYAPWSFRIGVALSVAALLAIVAYGVRGRRRLHC